MKNLQTYTEFINEQEDILNEDINLITTVMLLMPPTCPSPCVASCWIGLKPLSLNIFGGIPLPPIPKFGLVRYRK